MSWRHAYARAMTFAEFVAGAKKNQQLWQDIYRLTVIPSDLLARARGLTGRRHLLILVEDWCGDAVNTVPAIVRLAESAPDVDVRLLTRDANPDVMNAHLTGTSRSIPVVMVLDEAFEECGWWGPRPRELQSWVLDTGLAMEKAERYRVIRAWYARDRGRTTLEEVLRLLEPCAGRRDGERAAVA
jgi:hypothetical protein